MEAPVAGTVVHRLGGAWLVWTQCDLVDSPPAPVAGANRLHTIQGGSPRPVSTTCVSPLADKMVAYFAIVDYFTIKALACTAPRSRRGCARLPETSCEPVPVRVCPYWTF